MEIWIKTTLRFSYPSQNSQDKENNCPQMPARIWGKETLYPLLVDLQTYASIMEISVENS